MASAFKIDVGRSGVLFSTEVGVESIAKMLELRSKVPDVNQYHDGLRLNATPRIVMPLGVQKMFQMQAQDMWFKEHPDIANALGAKCSNKSQYARTARMVYRRECFKTFGGQEWMYMLLAVGDINDLLVYCADDAGKELVELKKRKLGDAYREPDVWAPAAAQRRKDREASASSAGPHFNGVWHTVAQSKILREEGRKLDKQIAKEQAAYDASRGDMSWNAWNALVAKADRVWAEAHKASDAVGVEYTARDNTIRFKRSQDDTWVGRTLAKYQKAIGEDLSCVHI